MQHWFALYEMQQARLREERDSAMARQAAQREAGEAREAERRALLVAMGGDARLADPERWDARGGRPGTRTPRRWTVRVPRLAVTITVDPEARR